jgi:hypothetical protein
VLTIWEGTMNVLSLDALRTLARPGVADAFGAELERLDSPRRADLEHQLVRLAAEDQASAQRSARRLAFLAAEAWVAGLLREAAGRGRREATVEELWALPTEPARGRRGAQPDHFDLLVDGAA